MAENVGQFTADLNYLNEQLRAVLAQVNDLKHRYDENFGDAVFAGVGATPTANWPGSPYTYDEAYAGAILLEQLRNFFNNQAVATADYAGTVARLKDAQAG